MKHPIWLINAVLLMLVGAALGFLVLSGPKVPSQTRLEPSLESKPVKRTAPKLDVAKIYDNDLFGTYKEPIAPINKPVETKSSMPQPPQPKPAKIPIAAPPRFLEPLSIGLKGIIIVSNEDENVAIIELNKTKETKNYKVGEKIDDAQLLRIMKNKVMFIRSNGQQETIYVNQYDAEFDQMEANRTEWNTIVKKLSTTSYQVDPETFVAHIKNLANLIDVFNATTVYAQGASVGIRIGQLEQKSLPLSMGLEHGDVITDINGTPATTTDNRFAIYQDITSHPDAEIRLTISRKGTPSQVTYILQSLQDPIAATPSAESSPSLGPTPEQLRDEKIRLLQEREKFAPTLQDLENKEKQNMLHHGRATDRRNQNVLFNSVK